MRNSESEWLVLLSDGADGADVDVDVDIDVAVAVIKQH